MTATNVKPGPMRVRFPLLALALCLTGVTPLPALQAAGDAPAPRFVRVRFDVTMYGIDGTGTLLVDRARGRFVRAVDAGPASEREGFDGRRSWRADASGWPRVEGNTEVRGAIEGWSLMLARAPRPASVARVQGAGTRRLVFAGIPQPLDVTALAGTNLPARVVRHVAEDVDTTTFADYRSVAGLIVPFSITDRSNNGLWTIRVRALETPRTVSDAAFAPPPAPHDYALARRTTVRMEGPTGIPIIGVHVNGGRELRFILDTGGQNVITPAAARAAGMAIAGSGTVGGTGAGLPPIRFARARSVRVGEAVMRDQAFIVLDVSHVTPVPIDGIVGYELLARFAARLNFRNATVELAPDAAAFGVRGTAVPIAFDERQPQTAGSIDGIPAVLTIDTGSNSSLDVNTPFVRRHALIGRYHATVSGLAISGVGGAVRAYYARAARVVLGTVAVRNAALLLTEVSSGTEIDPGVGANAGNALLRRFVIVFDYRRGTMRLAPGGDLVRPPWHDRSGIRLSHRAGPLRVGDVLTGTPAFAAGLRPGDIIVRIDGTPVASADRARVAASLNAGAGTVVRIETAAGRVLAIRLRDYMP